MFAFAWGSVGTDGSEACEKVLVNPAGISGGSVQILKFRISLSESWLGFAGAPGSSGNLDRASLDNPLQRGRRRN